MKTWEEDIQEEAKRYRMPIAEVEKRQEWPNTFAGQIDSLFKELEITQRKLDIAENELHNAEYRATHCQNCCECKKCVNRRQIEKEERIILAAERRAYEERMGRK